jgi:hypothetical protein
MIEVTQEDVGPILDYDPNAENDFDYYMSVLQWAGDRGWSPEDDMDLPTNIRERYYSALNRSADDEAGMIRTWDLPIVIDNAMSWVSSQLPSGFYMEFDPSYGVAIAQEGVAP